MFRNNQFLSSPQNIKIEIERVVLQFLWKTFSELTVEFFQFIWLSDKIEKLSILPFFNRSLHHIFSIRFWESVKIFSFNQMIFFSIFSFWKCLICVVPCIIMPLKHWIRFIWYIKDFLAWTSILFLLFFMNILSVLNEESILETLLPIPVIFEFFQRNFCIMYLFPGFYRVCIDSLWEHFVHIFSCRNLLIVIIYFSEE